MAQVTAVRPSRTQRADFDRWYAEHAGGLRTYARRLTGDPATAEDVVQETFARAWARVDQLSEREHVAPWLYRVARNLCVDTHRSRRRSTPTDEAEALAGADHAATGDPEHALQRGEEHAAVRRALGTLQKRHRDFLYLRDVKGVSYADLAAREGLSEESARAVIARARRRLLNELKTSSKGLFGLLPWMRLRFDGWIRAVNDRVPQADQVASALAPYAVAAAAVAGLALVPSAPSGADGTARPPAVEQPAAPRAGAANDVARFELEAAHRSTNLDVAVADSVEGAAAGARTATEEAQETGESIAEAAVGPLPGVGGNPDDPSGQGRWAFVPIMTWEDSEYDTDEMKKTKQLHDDVEEEYQDQCDRLQVCAEAGSTPVA